jgi:hypothetical protein
MPAGVQGRLVGIRVLQLLRRTHCNDLFVLDQDSAIWDHLEAAQIRTALRPTGQSKQL